MDEPQAQRVVVTDIHLQFGQVFVLVFQVTMAFLILAAIPLFFLAMIYAWAHP